MPAPSVAGPFDDLALEQQFLDERAKLTAPPKGSMASLVLIGSASVFFLLRQLSGGDSLEQAGLLVAVLFFHESGHWLGMRWFGYRDVKMFFIPFFGAAVSGKQAGVAPWKEAVVLLLGPLPGLILGVILLGLPSARASTPLQSTAQLLIGVNAFNLLPIGGLDGAQLFRRVLFSRHRHLEVAFLVLAGVGLLLVALWLQSWILGIFAYLGLVTVRWRAAILKAAHRLRRERGSLPADVAALDEPEARALFLAARDAVPAKMRDRPGNVSSAMQQMIDAARPAPGAGATTLLLGGWLGGVVLAMVALVMIVAHTPPRWQTHVDAQGGFTIELPGPPKESQQIEQTALGPLTAHQLVVHHALSVYRVEWFELPSPTTVRRWESARSDHVVHTDDNPTFREDTGIEQNGLVGRELTLVNQRRVQRQRFFIVGRRAYEVLVPTGAEGQRVLDSFILND